MRIALAILVMMGSLSSAVAQNEAPPVSVPHAEGIVEELAVSYPPPPEESSSVDLGPAVWSQSFSRPGAKVMQLHIKDIAFETDEVFEIEIIDTNGTTVQKLTNETLKGQTSVWTNNGRGQSLAIALYGNRNGTLRFTIDAISFDRLGVVLESIVGEDEREQLYAYSGDLAPMVGQVQGAVAKLTFIKPDALGPKRYVCTGFLVNDDTLVTNEHCVASAELCATTKIMFGYAFDRLGQMSGLEQYDCDAVVGVDDGLDIALLKIRGTPGPKWGTVKLAARDVTQDERLFVVQHPAGEPKQISDVGCKVFEARSPGRKAVDSDFAHMCDTLGGSSGAPVFNVAGEVVGLHHWGRDITGRYSVANRAVRIEPIKEFIASIGTVSLGGTTHEPRSPD